MSEVRLDWASAEVKDGELRVPLSDEPPDGWSEHFTTTVRLLGGGEWGEIRLKKARVRVAGVTPGDEDNVHFFLEGVVDQANAAVSSGTAESDDDEARRSGPDAEMTDRFRALGEHAQGDAEPECS